MAKADKVCVICGEYFTPTSRGQRFCGNECKYENHRRVRKHNNMCSLDYTESGSYSIEVCPWTTGVLSFGMNQTWG